MNDRQTGETGWGTYVVQGWQAVSNSVDVEKKKAVSLTDIFRMHVGCFNLVSRSGVSWGFDSIFVCMIDAQQSVNDTVSSTEY